MFGGIGSSHNFVGGAEKDTLGTTACFSSLNVKKTAPRVTGVLLQFESHRNTSNIPMRHEYGVWKQGAAEQLSGDKVRCHVCRLAHQIEAYGKITVHGPRGDYFPCYSYAPRIGIIFC